MLSQRSTPVKMSQEAARKLPRWSLLALLTIFAFSGFWATGLWTLRDALSFGTASAMLDGGASAWLMPMMADSPITEAGPLAGWLTAVIIAFGRLTGLMGDIAAVRFAACLLFALTTAALWYGTWHLARRPEAQPIAFAFGGEASPRDYSRVVADVAVLLFVATFGILTRQHEALPDTTLLTMAALSFYGLTLGIRRPVPGAFTAGLAAGLAVVSSTLFASCWLLVLALITIQCLKAFSHHRPKRLLITIAGALAGFLPWPLLAFAVDPAQAAVWFGEWLPAQLAHFSLAGSDTYLWFARNALWYLCPIWPFAIWGLYVWRHQIRQTHILLPAAALMAGIPAVVFSSFQAYDTVFLAFLPMLSVTAAFGLVTVRRGYENVLDWFSLTIFTLGLLVLWAYWFAWLTSFAPKMAESLQMLAPGITAFSASLVGLYHTALDVNRSYEPVVKAVARNLEAKGMQPGDVVCGTGMNHGLQAVFKHYADLDVLVRARPDECRFTIDRSRSGALLPDSFRRPHTDEAFTVIQNR